VLDVTSSIGDTLMCRRNEKSGLRPVVRSFLLSFPCALDGDVGKAKVNADDSRDGELAQVSTPSLNLPKEP
jgi:hypothetical protein